MSKVPPGQIMLALPPRLSPRATQLNASFDFPGWQR